MDNKRPLERGETNTVIIVGLVLACLFTYLPTVLFGYLLVDVFQVPSWYGPDLDFWFYGLFACFTFHQVLRFELYKILVVAAVELHQEGVEDNKES